MRRRDRLINVVPTTPREKSSWRRAGRSPFAYNAIAAGEGLKRKEMLDDLTGWGSLVSVRETL